MSIGIVVAVVVVALALGALIGWLLGSREGAGAKLTIDNLRMQLDEVVKERDQARSTYQQAATELAALQADARNFEQRMKDLAESKDALIAQFREVGDKLLEKAHQDFLDKAGEKFSKADQQSEAKLKELLQPVESTLKRYEEGLQRVEKERIDHYAGLREAVELVRAGQNQVRDEARNIVSALTSSSKVRGNWGEQSLRNVLELAGLSPYADFKSEVSVGTENGRLRPDVIVRLPNGGQMVVDAKLSFNSFVRAQGEVDDEKKSSHLQDHLSSIKSHVTKLASKNYWEQFEGSAEFVVMYIPGEHFLHAALEIEPDLWQWAIGKKVLLATPTNLLALAQTAAMYWKHDIVNREAQEIAAIGRDLHLRMCTMAEHMEKAARNLGTVNTAFNQMIGSFNDKLVPQARKIEQLGAASAKAIPDPPTVDTLPKSPMKLEKGDEPVVVSLDPPGLLQVEKTDDDEEESHLAK